MSSCYSLHRCLSCGFTCISSPKGDVVLGESGVFRLLVGRKGRTQADDDSGVGTKLLDGVSEFPSLDGSLGSPPNESTLLDVAL